jgi:sodium-dependent phosphate cotransporter
MIVGFVSAGTLPIANAVPIIMGANIGTTITNTIVSIGHIGNKYEYRRAFAGATIHDFFNVLVVIILLPIEMATGFLQKSAGLLSGIFYGSHTSIVYHSPIKKAAKIIPSYIKELLVNNWQISGKIAGIICLLLSFALIFLTLVCLVKVMRSVMIDKIERILNDFLGKSAFIAIAIGAIITMMVQSSSITTSLLVPMLGTGIITLETAFPITLGANIGTTITAILAALAGNVAGLTIAFVHLLFNIIGILLIYPIKKIRRIPLLWAVLAAKYTQKNKKLLVGFVLGVFFVIPLLFIFLSKLF